MVFVPLKSKALLTDCVCRSSNMARVKKGPPAWIVIDFEDQLLFLLDIEVTRCVGSMTDMLGSVTVIQSRF